MYHRTAVSSDEDALVELIDYCYRKLLGVTKLSAEIEKAQKELEAAIEAAKADTQAAMEKRLNRNEENKNEKLEVHCQISNSIVNLVG